MRMGKLIAIEGIDGSGKATQARLLLRRLKKEGYRAVLMSFPQYKTKSGTLIEEYLRGVYGSPETVGPYRAAIFYAADRYAASHKIRHLLEKGYIVIADRYIGSNLAHQGGKLGTSKQRMKFFRWLLELEYKVFAVPKPISSIFLDTPPALAQQLMAKRHRTAKKIANDVHERNRRHIIAAYRTYRELVRRFPHDFILVQCSEGNLLTPKKIHDRVWAVVKRVLG